MHKSVHSLVEHSCNTNEKLIIAVDGTSCSGKSTISRLLAHKIGFDHFDTGKLYRTLAAIMYQDVSANKHKIYSYNDLKQHKTQILHCSYGEGFLMRDEIGATASVLAEQQSVRQFMLEIQHQIIYSTRNGIVVEGRDIGSVVCPNAQLKFFITANIRCRAIRRFKQNLVNRKKCLATKQSLGKSDSMKLPYSSVLRSIKTRDDRDVGRKFAPLKLVDDAILIDNTELSINENLEKIITIINKSLKDDDKVI